MNNRRYKNIVYNHLRESKPFSLKILLEEEGEEEKTDAAAKEKKTGEESESEDIFDMGGEEDTSDDSENSGDLQNAGDSDRVETASVELATLNDIFTSIGSLRSLRTGVSGTEMLPSYGGINDSYAKKSISNFVLKEVDLEKPESVINDLESALDKNDDIISRAKFAKEQLKSGVPVDIGHEVSKAIDKLVHFREKVDIIDLIEDLFCDKIRLTAPAEDIERNIEEFKELYAEEVHKNRTKIDLPGSKHYNDESVYLDKHDGYNGAAGAKSQG